jgi:hypothetical protein
MFSSRTVFSHCHVSALHRSAIDPGRSQQPLQRGGSREREPDHDEEGLVVEVNVGEVAKVRIALLLDRDIVVGVVHVPPHEAADAEDRPRGDHRDALAAKPTPICRRNTPSLHRYGRRLAGRLRKERGPFVALTHREVHHGLSNVRGTWLFSPARVPK